MIRPGRGSRVDELPVILVIEDEYPVQGMVEEWLTEGGFGADILSSGEEALTLFQERPQKLQGARHRRQPERQAERLGYCETDQGDRPSFSNRLPDRTATRSRSATDNSPDRSRPAPPPSR